MTEPGRAAAERVAEALRLGRELRPAKGVRMDPAAITARLRRVAQLRELSRRLRVAGEIGGPRPPSPSSTC